MVKRILRKYKYPPTKQQEAIQLVLEQVVTELKNRGVQDIFIACVDGLKGFPEAIETTYPKDRRAALHRAYGALQLELRLVETAQGSC